MGNFSENFNFQKMIGKSESMQEVYEIIKKVAPTNANVLIEGESGTGKELAAESIHFNSLRKNLQMIPVNCSEFAESLLESELFGHEKGAFTGAESMRKGPFEIADKGTLFIDEIGELTIPLQVKLLRVLQERTIKRVGGTKLIPVDFRLISATNKKLESEVKNGTFREDLFYRVNGVRIRLPSLNERKDDIPLLIKHFIDKNIQDVSIATKVKGISPEAVGILCNYEWTGNVRELENTIQRLVIFCDGENITPSDLSRAGGQNLSSIQNFDRTAEGGGMEETDSELHRKFDLFFNEVIKNENLINLSRDRIKDFFKEKCKEAEIEWPHSVYRLGQKAIRSYNKNRADFLNRYEPEKIFSPFFYNESFKSYKKGVVILQREFHELARDKLEIHDETKKTQKKTSEIQIDELTISNAFKIFKKIDTIEPKDIFGIRAKKYRDYYFHRKIDDVIFETFRSHNILLKGKALAGKTRAIYQLLQKKSSEDPSILILIPEPGNLNPNSLSHIKKKFPSVVVVLDDIDQYFIESKAKAANIFIEELILNGCKILATCKNGPEFKQFYHNSTTGVKDVFKNLEIPTLSDDEFKEVVLYLNSDENDPEYDGNIGSLILPINLMRERYENLKDSKDDVDKIAINLLKSLKALNYSSNFHSKRTFEIYKLKEFCLGIHIGKHARPGGYEGNLMQAKMLEALKITEEGKIQFFTDNADAALQRIETDNFNLNFIIKKNNLVEVEEVYLDKIVQYKPYEIIADINKLYNKPEQHLRGFYVKPDFYNDSIKNCSDYKAALRLFEKMCKNGIKPNSETYVLLMRKAINYEDVLKWFNRAKKEEILSVSIFGEIIKKTVNKIAVIKFIKQMIETRTSLFDFDQALNWILVILMQKKDISILYILNLFVQNQIKLSSKHYSNFLSKTETFDQAKAIFDSIPEDVMLDVGLYANLMKKTETYDQAEKVLNLIPKRIVSDAHFFKILMEKAKEYDQAEKVLNLIPKHFILDVGLYYCLMEQAKKFDQAEKVLDLIPKHFILDVGLYYTFMKKAETYDQAKKVLDLTPKHLILDAALYYFLMQKAETYDQAKKVLDLTPKHLILDAALYYFLMQKAEIYDQAKEVFDLIPEHFILDAALYNSLMQKAETYDQAKEVFDLIPEHFILDAALYNSLMQKAETYDQAKEVFDSIPKHFILDVSLYNKLMQKAETYDQANEVIDFGIHNHLENIFSDWEFVLSLNSQSNKLLIENYWERIQRYQSCFKKVAINLILKSNLSENIREKNSFLIIKQLYDLSEKFFFKEFRETIQESIMK